MNTFIKRYKIIIYCFLVFTLWILISIGFIFCSFTDYCVLKKIDNNITLQEYIPKLTCDNMMAQGIKNIYTKSKLKVLVIPPKNHLADKKYSAIIVLPPAGKTVKKSENFYEGLTSLANNKGFIIAYANYLPLNETNLSIIAEVKDTLNDNYCINKNDITMLGHSDGATNAAIISYRDMGIKIKKLVISANGINNKALESEICPKTNFSLMVMHSVNDTFFRGFGRDNIEWLSLCSNCQISYQKLDNGCEKIKDCDREIIYCEGLESHNEWPKKNNIIIDFLR